MFKVFIIFQEFVFNVKNWRIREERATGKKN